MTPWFDNGTTGRWLNLTTKWKPARGAGKRLGLASAFIMVGRGYPEYPPHWIHVSPPVSDGQKVHYEYETADDRKWSAMSRPPQDIWDRLPVKDMKNYLNEHIRRFWNAV